MMNLRAFIIVGAVLALVYHVDSFEFDDMLSDLDDENGNETAREEPIKFAIKSLRDCNDRKDLVKFKKLFYTKLVSVPGYLEVNGTLQISKKLPDDWHVSVSVQAKSPMGYVTLPCNKKCDRKNVCSSGDLIRKCQEMYTTQTNTTSTSKPSGHCKCDYDKGLVEIPALKVPLELSAKRRSLLKKYPHSKEVKFEIVLKSAADGKRFACFRGIVQMI